MPYSVNQGCWSASRAVIRRRGSRQVILPTRSWNCGSTGYHLLNGILFLSLPSNEVRSHESLDKGIFLASMVLDKPLEVLGRGDETRNMKFEYHIRRILSLVGLV